MITIFLAFAACGSNSEDRWGGGEVSLSFLEGSAITGTHVLSGASVKCMRDSYCPSPYIGLDSVRFEGDDSGVLYTWSISALFDLAAANYDIPCFNEQPLELSFYVVWREDEISGNRNHVGFSLEDPVALAEESERREQGEGEIPSAPSLIGETEYEEPLIPFLEGSIDGVLELDGAETGCEEVLNPIDFVFEWSFDKEVSVGPGYQTLEEE